MADELENRSDMLAQYCVKEALNEKIDLSSLARKDLRDFVWRKLFGDLPEGRGALQEFVTNEMHEKMDHLFEGD